MVEKGGENKNEAVKVAIRCRPMNQKEIEQGHQQAVTINKERKEMLVKKPFTNEDPKQFTFDMTYGEEAL